MKDWVTDEVSRVGLPAVMTVVLTVNSVLIFMESYQDLQHNPRQKGHMFATKTCWGFVNMAFSLVYGAELGIKLATIPFAK